MNRQELAQILVRANEFKEGDLLVGGTRDEIERQEARRRLSALRLRGITGAVLVEDGVRDALAGSLDSRTAAEVSNLTVGELKQALLGANAPAFVRRYRDGLASECIAAVVKIMSNAELSAVARALFNPLPGAAVTVGSATHFGSRIQPNS